MMVIVLLALIALTGCRTLVRTDKAALQVLVSQVPDLPDTPEWPSVTWSYSDGRYYLLEGDVDKVLDYLENQIPQYKFEIGQYEEQLQIVLDGILSI